MRGYGEIAARSIVLYPFFSHIAAPVKTGEHVWVIFELSDERNLGYWMTRAVEPRHVEDKNYTHSDRKWSQGGDATLTEKAGAAPADDPAPGFPNGLDVPEAFTLVQAGAKNAYDELVKGSDASKVHVTEPVPRFRKRPADHTIEGSNNTLIVLGQDRSGIPVEYDGKGNAVAVPKSDQTKLAGAIDIVVGRGQDKKKNAPTTIKNSRGETETDKRLTEDIELPTEGDVDFETDLSRVFVSMLTDVDERLGFNPALPNTVEETNVQPAPAFVAKSDTLRLVARRDIKIVVAPLGADVEADPELFASIIMKSTGDIIFIPSKDGVIKLGSEFADRAILCTDMPAHDANGLPLIDLTKPVPGGKVTYDGIETTMGGKVGSSKTNGANLGTFCTKVLVVGN